MTVDCGFDDDIQWKHHPMGYDWDHVNRLAGRKASNPFKSERQA